MRNALLALSLAAVAVSAAPALAASQHTARATGNLPVRSGPGAYYAVVGTLKNNSKVHLERCTRESNWCLVLDPDGDEIGWVRGSYLVGSPAKLEVTPHSFLEFDPLDPLDFHKRHWPNSED